MKIVHYNTYSEGGSAVLMRRLHDALRAMGHDSSIRYRQGHLQITDAKRIEYCSSWLDRQRERVQHRFENLILNPNAPSYYSRLIFHKPTRVAQEDCSADIIHLHWIGRWLDLPSFLDSAPKHIPIIWTIHDMSPLAGGCFANFGCKDLGEGCRRCPLLKSPFNLILPRKEFLRRKKALSGRRVYVVGNSRNTTELIKKSALFQDIKSVDTILPAINPNEFIRHDKTEARRLLGINPERFVIGFGAASLTDENKGFIRFIEVAEKVAVRMDGIDALVFGEGISATGSGKLKVHTLGRISSPMLQSLVYSAMDVFIVASRMETFGQVATEAQACGTPVWAFDVGGLGDAIQDGVTGRLIPFSNTEAMAESICAAANLGNLTVMGEAGARWVRETCTTDRMADAYLRLYEQALAPAASQVSPTV